MITIDLPSCQSLYLEMRSGSTALGSATGFVVEHEGVFYLVTNRHNVRGRRQDNDQAMHESGAVPDQLAIFQNLEGETGAWVSKVEPLYHAAGDPLWHEHPTLGGAIDVVVLRLTDLKGVACYPYSLDGPTGHDAGRLPAALKIGPSDVVNIIGFPFGWTAGAKLGIWVQGAIASEPALAYEDLPQFLIDSRTRPGQSGSPVVLYLRSGWVTLDGHGPYMIHNPLTQLLGVYSGRLSPDSDLGTVWKPTAVAEILSAI